MKIVKKLFFVYIFSLLFLSTAPFALAVKVPSYTTLTTIGSQSSLTFDDSTTSNSDLSTYLNFLYKMGVAACAGLAVIMVIWGGIEYITSVAGEGKSGGKEKITSAILGLLLALGSYIILNTINPDLLNLSFNLDPAPTPVATTNAAYVPSTTGTTGTTGTTVDPVTGQVVSNSTYPTITDGGFNEDLGMNTSSTVTGLGTEFGYNDKEDNGVGSPILGNGGGTGVLTNDPNVGGVALPQTTLEQYFGIEHHAGTNSDPLVYSDWSSVRNSAVEVTNGTKTTIVPIVDLGPGTVPQSRGVVIDETHAVYQQIGGDNVSYKIIPDYYSTNTKPDLTYVKP